MQDTDAGLQQDQNERRSTTIVAADIVGYSRLISLDEDAVVTRFRKLRDGLVVPKIIEGKGRVIKTMGDGLLMEFPSPEAALTTALAVQNAMQQLETDLPDAERLRFRIGINYGEGIVDSDDVLGDVVNVAARLEGIAPPGGICMSQAARERLPETIGVKITSLGHQYVKNMPVPVSAWNVHVDGVRADAGTPVKLSERPSVAVLAFENLSSDPDQSFLADGIAGDVTAQLSRFRSLFVTARNSAFAYRGTHTNVRQIAQELGVSYVVEGSVRRAGDRIRCTVSLIRAQTGETLWTRNWNREVADVFDLQDDLTKAIVSEIAPQMGATERSLALKKPTESLTAWELCQRGLGELFSYTPESYRRALDLFEASAKADPDFALPHAMMARWYAAFVASGRSTDPVADLTKGIACGKTAIAMDDRLDDGYVTLGAILSVTGRIEEASDALDRAYALNDNNLYLYQARSWLCTYKPEIDADGLEQASRDALALSPKDPSVWLYYYNIATAQWARDPVNGHLDAREALEKSCSFDKTEYFPWLSNGCMNVRLGRLDVAKDCVARALEINPALTMEGYRTGLRFPSWPTLFEAFRPDMEVLVELGLPRG